MRLLPIALLTIAATSTASSATQQQCEALMKPVEAKMAAVEQIEGSKPTPQACALVSDAIKTYGAYQAQADKLNCPFAYVSGQKIGGAAERADLLGDMKKAYSEKCR